MLIIHDTICSILAVTFFKINSTVGSALNFNIITTLNINLLIRYSLNNLLHNYYATNINKNQYECTNNFKTRCKFIYTVKSESVIGMITTHK